MRKVAIDQIKFHFGRPQQLIQSQLQQGMRKGVISGLK